MEKELQLQPRLQCIASLVPQGARLADVGTDHGYLPVWLLQHGRIESAIASDINALPLDHARATAREYSVTERMDFRLCPGLAKIKAEECDAIAIAGMGGETILGILEAAPWTHEGVHTLILQPQSAGQALRQYLAGHGFLIEREALAQDGHFLYTVLRAKKGTMPPLTPGQQYATPQLLAEGGPLLGAYLARIEAALAGTVRGLQKASEPEKLRYYQTALAEIQEMRKQHDDCP